jgi:hypothetical protein
MGFKFRKSIRLFPGVKVNLSRSGTSVSVGGKGVTTNYSKRGTRSTFSIPGTGVSYTTSHSKTSSPSSGQRFRMVSLLKWLFFVGVVLVLLARVF